MNILFERSIRINDNYVDIAHDWQKIHINLSENG
jgi:hypothetical protein